MNNRNKNPETMDPTDIFAAKISTNRIYISMYCLTVSGKESYFSKNDNMYEWNKFSCYLCNKDTRVMYVH